jgi:acyl-CoA reductase-like NAD-dependent aldehyde dehydrogenase
MFDVSDEISPVVRAGFFIGGQWCESDSPRRIPIVDPASEETVCEVPLASAEEVDRAVAAARVAFDVGPWPRLSAAQRSGHLHALADALTTRLPLLARLWTAQVGAPIRLTRQLVHAGTNRLRFYADLAATYEFEGRRPTSNGSARVRKEPKGVAALIIPWNAAFPILSYKLGAALAAGCTCIVKPSPESPLDALVVAECAKAAGLPDGVVNVITADREESARLVSSRGVDKISFTGSVAVGRQILAAAAANMTRTTIELGGKSAAILLDDADLAQALSTVAPFTMPFAGQTCFAQTRILAPRTCLVEVAERYASIVRTWKLGDPWDETTQMGPVLNRRQMDRVLSYIDSGLAEGARLVIGGKRAAGFERGFFIEPTVFTDVLPEMTIAREEIFGPVVTIQPYDSVEDAVRIANDTDFGLSGTIFSSDPERAYRVACRIRSGQIGVNRLELIPSIPFGGFKQSGIGREGGLEGLEEYLETKAVFMPAISAGPIQSNHRGIIP